MRHAHSRNPAGGPARFGTIGEEVMRLPNTGANPLYLISPDDGLACVGQSNSSKGGKKMTEEQLRQLFILIRRPIPWDPIPWWIKLNKEQIVQFNEVQVRLNSKIAELEVQKIKELSKITGMEV
jgi:hypothetical protein